MEGRNACHPCILGGPQTKGTKSELDRWVLGDGRWFGWYQLRCRDAHGPMTGPHTQAMTCARLSNGEDLHTGSQEKCHCHLMWSNHRALVEKIQRSIRKMVPSLGFQLPGQQTFGGLLRDWALLTAAPQRF